MSAEPSDAVAALLATGSPSCELVNMTLYCGCGGDRTAFGPVPTVDYGVLIEAVAGGAVQARGGESRGEGGQSGGGTGGGGEKSGGGGGGSGEGGGGSGRDSGIHTSVEGRPESQWEAPVLWLGEMVEVLHLPPGKEEEMERLGRECNGLLPENQGMYDGWYRQSACHP